MPGRAKSDTRKRQEARQKHDALLTRAVEAYREANGGKGYRQVCKDVTAQHFIETGENIKLNYKTLERRHKGGLSITEARGETSWLKREEEVVLVQYTKEVAARGFPFSHRRLKEHVDSLLRARLGDSFPESGVGKNWTQRFIERHCEHLTTYWSRPLDTARGRAVNPTTHKLWFDLYEGTKAEYDVPDELIYGADEGGFMSGMGARERVIGGVGKSVQHQLRSGNRETITVIATICADGTALPPTVIFKGKGYQVKWKQDNPLNASLGYSVKGWTDGEIGVEWIKNFDNLTREKARGRYRMLIVDGHNSHYTWAFLDYARSHWIVVLCYPAHSTHIYQGLDVAVFATLKSWWSQMRDEEERRTGQKVSKENFLRVFGLAWVKALTTETIKAAFSKTGLVPFNPDVIPAEAMAPARETTSESALPLPQPSPVRVIGTAFRQLSRAARAPATPVSRSDPDGPDSDMDTHIDPILRTAQRSRELLRSTSAAFLVNSSPIRASSSLPTHHFATMVTPPRPAALDIPAQTETEAALQAALKESHERELRQHSTLVAERSSLVLTDMYCQRVRGQLHAADEKKASKKGKEKLVGDGLPRLLTGDTFALKVKEHEEGKAREADEAKHRKVLRTQKSAKTAEWKAQEEVRKTKNAAINAAYQAEVALWETERDQAKEEHRRPAWKKPTRGKLLPPIPRPKDDAVEDDEGGDEDERMRPDDESEESEEEEED